MVCAGGLRWQDDGVQSTEPGMPGIEQSLSGMVVLPPAIGQHTHLDDQRLQLPRMPGVRAAA
jgi:hypothetical protein